MISRKFLIAGLSLGLVLAGAGAAMAASDESTQDTSQQTVTIGGNVTNLCILGSPSQSSIPLGQMADTAGTNVGKITSIAPQSVTLQGSFCNFAGTHVSITADALVAADTSTVQSGFSRAVNFNSTVTTWADSAPSVTTTADLHGANLEATGSGGTLGAPKLTDLTLTLSQFTTAGGSLLLVAGNYAGSVTVTLGPSANLP